MATVSELPLDDPSFGSLKDVRSNSLWRLTGRRFLRQRSAIVGAILLAILILMAVAAPILAPYEPDEQLIGKENVQRRQGPCIHLLGCPPNQPQHLMGVDANFRDVFSRIVYGARVSLWVGFVTVSFSITVGTFLGAVSGYVGGWLDNVIMRFMDIILAFPFLLLAIAIVSVLGPGLTNAMLAIATVSMPAYARVIRASVLSVRETAFV